MKNTLYFLLIAISFYSCYDERSPVKRITADLLPKIDPPKLASVLANGEDKLEIKVLFPLGSNPDKMKVDFTSKEGVFNENGKAEYSSSDFKPSINALGNVEALYISANLKSTVNEGDFPVIVEVPDIIKRELKVTFSKSYPETVTTDKNKFAVTDGFKDEIQLIANVKAKKGLPSKGTPVEFIVDGTLSSINNPEYFRALTKTDTNGQATVFFSPRNFKGTYTGPILYEVKVLRDSGQPPATAHGTFQIVQ